MAEAASVSVWLRTGHDGEPRVLAIARELLAFTTWAETRAELEDWRTIRANLAHVATGETQYCLRNVGCAPKSAPIDARGDWGAALARAWREAHGVAR